MGKNNVNIPYKVILFLSFGTVIVVTVISLVFSLLDINNIKLDSIKGVFKSEDTSSRKKSGNDDYKEIIKGDSNSLYRVEKNNKVSYIDKDFKTVIKPSTYDYGRDFKEGVAIVSKGDKVGVINSKGREIFKLEYDDITDFNEGYALGLKGGNIDILSLNGDITCLSGFYTSIYRGFESGRAVITLNSKSTIIDYKGNIILDNLVEPYILDGMIISENDIYNLNGYKINEEVELFDYKNNIAIYKERLTDNYLNEKNIDFNYNNVYFNDGLILLSDENNAVRVYDYNLKLIYEGDKSFNTSINNGYIIINDYSNIIIKDKTGKEINKIKSRSSSDELLYILGVNKTFLITKEFFEGEENYYIYKDKGDFLKKKEDNLYEVYDDILIERSKDFISIYNKNLKEIYKEKGEFTYKYDGNIITLEEGSPKDRIYLNKNMKKFS